MQYKLVVLDMDGTLLNGEHEVSEENRETIMGLMEQGVQFVLASGRPYESIVPYVKDLGLELPIISANGALVKSVINNEVYFSSSLPMQQVEEILDFADQTSFAVSLYLENEIVTFDEEMVNLHSDLEGLKAKKINNFSGNNPIIKILLTDHPDKVNKTISWFESKYKNDLYITSSEPNYLEVMNINASKGIAINNLIKKMDLSAKEVVVMGNNFNDVTMFGIAGLSVAMSNSPQRVREVADFVTKSNVENGVAYALERIFSK